MTPDFVRLPDGAEALPDLAGRTVVGLVARRTRDARLAGLRGHPLRVLDLSGSVLDHRELVHLSTLPLEILRLTGTTLVDLDVLRTALAEAAEHDLSARMVLSEAWEERFEFRWEAHGEAFEVQDQGPLPAFGVEHQVPVHVPPEERRRRLKQAADLYELDLRALHGALDGVRALASLDRLTALSMSWTPVGDDEVSALAGLGLERLELAGTAVCDPKWPTTLRALDVFGCSVRQLPAVSELRLGGISLGGEQCWPSVQHLALHECRGRGFRLMAPLCTALTLHGSHLDSLEGLAGLPLDSLDLGRCVVEDWSGLAALRARKVRVSRSSLDDAALEHLVELRCEVLDLGLSRIQSIEALRAALPDTEIRYSGLFVEEAEE